MNASDVAQTALQTIDKLHTGIIPQAVAATVTRNYGETAKDKSNELLEHMLIATVSVVVLVGAVFAGGLLAWLLKKLVEANFVAAWVS